MQFYLGVFALLLTLHLIALLLTYVIDYDGAPRFVRFFDFDQEENAPTLFSVFLIVQASVVCLMISRYNVPDRKHWL